MFVALSKFVVGNGMTKEVKQAFIDRPHKVDDESGFIKLDVISPMDNPDEIWLITYWQSKESFEVWHKSHLYKESHAQIPKGLRLVPRSAEMKYFEYVSS